MPLADESSHPPDATVIEALSGLLGTPDRAPCRPDIWLKHQTDETDTLLELKAHGFSAASTNSRQALKLLSSAVDLSASLGAPRPVPGHVIYVTGADDTPAMARTLTELQSKLSDLNIRAAPSGCISFSEESTGIALSSPQASDLPAPARQALKAPAVVLHRDRSGNDLQPLYLIPWIPGIDDSQDPTLRAEGLRELTARLLTQTIAAVGGASIPCNLSLFAEELLTPATFGIFARWQDGDRKAFSNAAAKIIERALRSTGAVRLEANRIDIDLPTSAAQLAAIERLERSDPTDPAKNLATVVAEQPTLFDDLP